jgi:hypothetical protein
MKGTLRAALRGTAIAGTLDIVYAIVFYGLRGVPAMRILQSVASGLLGAPAYRGGWPTALLGLVLHFAIMFVIAALFVAAHRRLAPLRQHAVAAGAVYGLVVYGVMNYIVLPLSAFAQRGTPPALVIALGVLVHVVLVGIPIALCARHCAKHKATP